MLSRSAQASPHRGNAGKSTIERRELHERSQPLVGLDLAAAHSSAECREHLEDEHVRSDQRLLALPFVDQTFERPGRPDPEEEVDHG